jgi:hypothetical protein
VFDSVIITWSLLILIAFFFFLLTSILMPTPADIRKEVDGIDDLIRASVRFGDVEEVFGRKRKVLVSKLYLLLNISSLTDL